jgi:hypothetical protein
MRKLRLELDELEVETFEAVARDGGGRGTVMGLQPTPGCVTGLCPPSVNPCVTRDTACLTDYC